MLALLATGVLGFKSLVPFGAWTWRMESGKSPEGSELAE